VSGIARFIALVFCAGLAVARSGDAMAVNDATTVTAQLGGVAAGGNIEHNTINFGFSPEQVRELTEAVARGLRAEVSGRFCQFLAELRLFPPEAIVAKDWLLDRKQAIASRSWWLSITSRAVWGVSLMQSDLCHRARGLRERARN
jgi:hypothetical protein